jgi:hypothetical protein
VKFCWWPSDGVLEVRSGVDVWRVKASRAIAWYSERFPTRRDAQWIYRPPSTAIATA